MFNRRSFVKLLSGAAILPYVPAAFGLQDESPELPTILNYTKEGQVYISCMHKQGDQLTLAASDPQGVIYNSESTTKYNLPSGEFAISRFFFSKFNKNIQYELKITSMLNRKALTKSFVLPDLDSKTCRLAVISCTSYRQSVRTLMWNKVYATHPDAILFIGDAVYADSFVDVTLRRPASVETYIGNFVVTWQHVSHYTRDKLIPTLSVWDDHDFGWDNGSGDRPDKKTITEIYRNFYYVPPNSDRITSGPGISFSWDAFGSRFIFLDDRTFRSYSKSLEVNTCWGADQKAWVEKQVKESPVKYIFMINGSQFHSNEETSDGVSNNHKIDFDWMIGLTTLSPDRKIVLVSGDVHYSNVQKVQHQGRAIYEITSSCLHCVVAGEGHKNDAGAAQLAYCGDQNFILVDLDSSTGFSMALTCVSKAADKAFSLKIEPT